MTQDDEDPKDWEMEDEDPPENLKRKWIEQEYFGNKTVVCASCKKHIPADSVTCLFYEARVYHDTGLLGKILKWLKGAP